ncbi:hypothetical protein E2320_012466 [Naja naja]|nr:hypothetical protein E2320_012466 [Naja naja]
MGPLGFVECPETGRDSKKKLATLPNSQGQEIRTPTPEDEEPKEQMQSKDTSPSLGVPVEDNLFEAGREDDGSPGTRDDEGGPASTEELPEARTEEDSPGPVGSERAKSVSLEPESSEIRRPSSRAGSTTALESEKSKMSLRSHEPPSDSEMTSLETGMETSQKESETSRTQTTASSATMFQEEDSMVLSAFPGMLFEEKTQPLSDHPLSLSWVFGYNSHLPVFNLLDEDQRVLLYVSAHTAVIHDILKNKQYLLQGHSSCISCVCVSDDRRWIATADRGPHSLVILWDSYSAIPVHTIFDSHPKGGVSAITLSHDSKFLATIGAEEVQKVSIWKWTTLETKPFCSVEVPPQFGFQNYIEFSLQTAKELVSNSESQVVFYLWTFNKAVGFFSQSRFHFCTSQALTGTSEGKLVVWDTVCTPLQATCDRLYNIKAIKLVHLQKDAITVLAIMDELFVTCDIKGHIKFYDGDLQLTHWYSQFKLGPIRSFSFSKKPASPEDVTKYPESCTLSGKYFIVRNFIVATSDAVVIHVKTEGTQVTKCLEEPKDPVHTVICHPCKPLLAKGSYCGLLKVWSYLLNKYLVSRIFKGSLLAAGFLNGDLYILDSISLENDHPDPFQYSKGPITLMSFSHNSEYLATAEKKIWDRLAALHSHYKPIRTLLFGVYLDSSEPRLLSLGEDRLLVEYDLANTVKNELVVIRRDRIEQNAVPTYIAWYPPITTEYFFLTANNHYKMKLYNVTTKLCRKTALGPTYGSPLQKFAILPLGEDQESQKRYMAYITEDKVGLQILPIDGNPHKSSAFICHPTGVADLTCSYTGRYLFTAGGSDSTCSGCRCLPGWQRLDPILQPVGRRQGWCVFQGKPARFGLVQLVHQGINTMEPRKVSTHIPLEQVPFVIRAMGFYPSEDQIEDMLNEVKFGEFLDTGKQVTHINLGDFIKLYVNHRPAFGLASQEIQQAFEMGAFHRRRVGRVSYHASGLQPRGRPCSEDIIQEEIPEEVTAAYFTKEILALPLPEPTDVVTEAQTPDEAMNGSLSSLKTS